MNPSPLTTQTTVRSAIFPVAGFGTRFLPATKASPKEMLPIVDKPLIQYAVEEAYAAGIRNMIFITGRNKWPITEHFDIAYELEDVLKQRKKDESLRLLQEIKPADMSVIFIRQEHALGLGHAVRCAAPALDRQAFAVLLADDFILSPEGEQGVLSQMIALFQRYGDGIIGVEPVAREHSKRYGMIAPGETLAEGLTRIQALVEKPEPSEAPSDQAVIGRYILPYEIMDLLHDLPPGAGGEIQLTDALALCLQQGGTLLAYRFRGQRYDCGNKFGYLQANIAQALRREDLRQPLQDYLLQLYDLQKEQGKCSCAE